MQMHSKDVPVPKTSSLNLIGHKGSQWEGRCGNQGDFIWELAGTSDLALLYCTSHDLSKTIALLKRSHGSFLPMGSRGGRTDGLQESTMFAS